MVRAALTGGDAERVCAARHGLLVGHPSHPGMVVVSNTHSALARVFHLSSWATGWGMALRRLPGAVIAPVPYWFNKHRTRGVLVPATLFAEVPS
jgi:hypothetical protein